MIELVFVIVVLGILAAIAIPRFAATRDDAQIAKGRSDVAAIRAGIVAERQSRLLTGDTAYITALEDAGEDLFSNVMQYGITAENKNGHWHKDNNTYNFKVLNTDVPFEYNATNGTFNCTGTYCSKLTQ
jgi:general secretion pathway protein G